jgi:ketosteroid isomerase-like protein
MKAIVAVIAAIIALGALFWFYTAPRAPGEITQAEIAQIEAEVTQAIADQWDGYVDAVLRGDVQGILAYWTPDVRIWGQDMNLDRTGYEDHLNEVFGAGGEVYTYDTGSYEVFVHGDVAYQIGQFDEAFQLPGEDPAEILGYFFIRWEKQSDGSWKFDRVMWGPREAPPEG